MKKLNLQFLLLIPILSITSCFGTNFLKNTTERQVTNTAISPYINFTLSISKADFETFTRVFYILDKTTGFDSGYDSQIFGGVASSFVVFTKHISEDSDKVDDKLAIQTLPNNNFENMVIPMGIIAATGEEITTSVVSENFPANLNIFIEDRTHGTFTNLSETNYTFTHTGEESGRFFIHTNTTYNYTWSGATNNNWNLPSNWNENEVPSSNANVIIPNTLINYPTLSSAVTVNSLSMAPLSTLITNGFDITATLIYKKYLNTNWHLISMPVYNETINNLITNNNFATGTQNNIGIGIYNNNETSSWLYQTSASTGSIDNGLGLAVRLNTANEISFQGSINASDITYTISNGISNNFNLLGNPFTAHINSAALISANSTILSEQTVWLWDEDRYITYNLSNPTEIAPTQGFFVEANTLGTFTFNISNQSHSNTDILMRQEPNPHFELSVENGNIKNTTKVFYLDGKTTGFDNGYDSKMFGGTDYDFAIFTELVTENAGNKLAIQTLPTDNVLAIPVGIIAKAGEELTFSIETIALAEDKNVYLEDTLNNEFVNLSENYYKITLDEDSNGVGRFYIHTAAKTLNITDINNLDKVSIYKSSNNELTVTGLNATAKISLYSLLGKEILKTTIDSNGVSKINLPSLHTGVYIVNLKSDLGTIHQKITLE